MIDGLKPYPVYRDSGLPWMGKIPAHWEVCRIKNLFREKDERSGDGSGVLLSLTRAYGLLPQAEASSRIASVEDLSKYKVCSPGELVMNRMQAWSGMFAVSRQEGLVSPDYSVFCAIGTVDVRYFEYLFKTSLLVDQFAQRSKGIGSGFNRLYTPDFGAIPVTVPPPEGQRAIVRFLDHHDRLIRRYIRAQHRLIELLTEQKQVLIQQAVTRGLDPHVKLKPSGVEWLGDIPEHWEAIRSRFIFREVDERSTTGEEAHLSMSQKLGLVPSSHIEERRLMSESYVGAKLCQRDDLVLNRLKAHLGVFALAPEPGLVSPDYTVLQAVRPIGVRYFELTLRTPACRIELCRRVKGIVVGFWRLYTDDFYSITLPFPPLEEQSKIVEYIDLQSQKLDETIERTQRQIDLIREYRTRLIADVVTGKFDVRGVSLPDLEEAGDLGDLDDMEEDTELDDLDAEELNDAE